MPQFGEDISQKFISKGDLPSGVPVKFLTGSMTLLGFAVLIYFGLSLGYKGYLDSQVSAVDSSLSKQSAKVNQVDLSNFINFYSQLVNLSGLLKTHASASPIFTFLEKNTSQNVYYDSVILDVPNGTAKLRGVTKSYDILAQQLGAFDRAPEVSKVLLESSQTSDLGVGFSIKLSFKPELFQFK